MSSPPTRDHPNPDDPLYFAPPRLRRGPDFSPPAQETKSDRQRSISSASRVDALVKEAIAESREPSPDSEIAPDPRAFVFERDRGRGLLSVAARFAIAIVASAVVAFFFIVMVPMSRRSEPPTLAVTESPAVAAPATPAPTNAAPDESRALLQKFMQSKPAVTESPAVAATATPAPTNAAPDQSRELLQKFMQWQQRDGPGQPAGR